MKNLKCYNYHRRHRRRHHHYHCQCLTTTTSSPPPSLLMAPLSQLSQLHFYSMHFLMANKRHKIIIYAILKVNQTRQRNNNDPFYSYANFIPSSITSPSIPLLPTKQTLIELHKWVLNFKIP